MAMTVCFERQRDATWPDRVHLNPFLAEWSSRRIGAGSSDAPSTQKDQASRGAPAAQTSLSAARAPAPSRLERRVYARRCSNFLRPRCQLAVPRAVRTVRNASADVRLARAFSMSRAELAGDTSEPVWLVRYPT